MMRRGQWFQLLGAFLLGALSGCAGFQEAYQSRVCWSEGMPAQCSQAFLEFKCSAIAAVLPSDHLEEPRAIHTDVKGGVDSAHIGELFSQRCPPECIPIYVTGGSPWQTLHDDVQDILAHAGYQRHAETTEKVPSLKLDLVNIDVRSEDPGWTSLKITTRASVSFSAQLITSDGQPLWSGEFTGTDEIQHAYASLSDYQAILDNAYCKALKDFSKIANGEMPAKWHVH